MRAVFFIVALATGVVALAACSVGSNTTALPGAGAGIAARNAAALGASEVFSLPANVVRACSPDTPPAVAHCLALIRTDVGGSPDVAGYGPAQLQSAYELPSAKKGRGQTIAIVDAFDDPNAESDVATYRSNFGLPACDPSNPCFTKVNQKGRQGPYPAPNSGWAAEESLDVDMVSAICPNCDIILVEADNSTTKSLGKAVDEAVKLGANVVSNSYIGYGAKGAGGAQYYNHPGTILTAGAGDRGYGVGEPAGFPTVVSVGGTSLRTASNGRRWTETVWGGTGSGCEKLLVKPSWQTDSGCAGRTMNDVAAVADPSTGVAVYDTYHESGWIQLGGTSVATPIIAAVYGLAGNAASLNAAQTLYAKNAPLWDVTSGSDGICKVAYLCTGETGYDGPTGNGTPNGVRAF